MPSCDHPQSCSYGTAAAFVSAKPRLSLVESTGRLLITESERPVERGLLLTSPGLTSAAPSSMNTSGGKYVGSGEVRNGAVVGLRVIQTGKNPTFLTQ
jgi:hypothetical protein